MVRSTPPALARHQVRLPRTSPTLACGVPRALGSLQARLWREERASGQLTRSGRAARGTMVTQAQRSGDGRVAKARTLTGFDGTSRQFNSATEMWEEFAGQAGIDSGDVSGDGARKTDAEAPLADDVSSGQTEKRQKWYNDGLNYWKRVEASVDGVLGGYGKVSPLDISDSRAFLLDMYGQEMAEAKARGRATVALDCGAGVGRISKGLLLPLFSQVDLVEPAPHFLDQAKTLLTTTPHSAPVSTLFQTPSNSDTVVERSSDGPHASTSQAVNFFLQSLQDFTPPAGRYDVIWVQWCIGHLTDKDLVSFFSRALSGLRPGGLLVLKENVCQQGFVVDNDDCSVTRSDTYFRELFNQAGLQIVASRLQKRFPKELFSVKMFALRERACSHKEPTRKRTRNAPKLISL